MSKKTKTANKATKATVKGTANTKAKEIQKEVTPVVEITPVVQETMQKPKKAKKKVEKEVVKEVVKVEQDNTKLVWEEEPKQEERAMGVAHYWGSTCNRYRVYRIDSQAHNRIQYSAQYHTSKGNWDKCEKDNKDGEGYPKHVKTLEEALLMAERYHMATTKNENLSSNREAVMAKARTLGLNNGRVVAKKPEKGGQEGVNGSTNTRQAVTREKVGVGLDRFGSRLDTLNAQINAILGSTPKTMKNIMEELGLKETHYNHVNKLAKKGLILKTTEGYVVAPVEVSEVKSEKK